MSNRTRGKNKSGDGKGQANDSPETAGSRKDITHPWPPFGDGSVPQMQQQPQSSGSQVSD